MKKYYCLFFLFLFVLEIQGQNHRLPMVMSDLREFIERNSRSHHERVAFMKKWIKLDQYLDQLEAENHNLQLQLKAGKTTQSPARRNSTQTSKQPKARVNSQKTPSQPAAYDSEARIKTERVRVQRELKGGLAQPGFKLELFGARFDAYIVDLRKNRIEVFREDDYDRRFFHTLASVVDEFGRRQNALKLATNGGIFNKRIEPVGLLVQNGKLLQEVDSSRTGAGNFYLQPNGIFLITKDGEAHVIPTSEYGKYAGRILHATQSGPMLLTDNGINGQFGKKSQNYRLRSGVGMIDEQTVVFIISRDEVNFYNFSRLFEDIFGCKKALFLDGTVSRMYCPELGRTSTRATDFGSIIGVYSK